jgi:hypothetical protein
MSLSAKAISRKWSWNATPSGNAAAINGVGAVTVCGGLGDSKIPTMNPVTTGQGWVNGGYVPFDPDDGWTPSGGWAGMGLKAEESAGNQIPSWDPISVLYDDGVGTVELVRPSQTESTSKFPMPYTRLTLGNQAAGVSNMYQATLDISKLPSAFQGALDIDVIYWGDTTNGGTIKTRFRRDNGQGFNNVDIDSSAANGLQKETFTNVIQAANNNVLIWISQHNDAGDQTGKTFEFYVIVRVNGATTGLVWLPLGLGNSDSQDWSQQVAGGGIVDDAELDDFVSLTGINMVVKALGQNDALTSGNRATLEGYESALLDRWMGAMSDAGVATPRWVSALVERTTKDAESMQIASEVQAGELLDQIAAGRYGVSFVNLWRYNRLRAFTTSDPEIKSDSPQHYTEAGALKLVGQQLWDAMNNDEDL